ncbi:MAG: AbrB/MazE/SpoVT family DNA-binding domain-containing protein [Elusimicrobia bacterium]|nr:AbrB/MazE/SpoVT family DNA-binding domain-containing protein [Elusimicrobiota bacterium]
METTLDKFGRVVIPKEVRDDLGLQPGAVLLVEEHPHEILLRPVQGEPQVIVKDGILVFTGHPTGHIADALHAHREERLKRLSPRVKQ